jgi:hypothetical protein
MEIEYIHELIVPGRRLGRHIDREARRAALPYQGVRKAIQSVNWTRTGSILNQGDVGSCTANASVGALECDPNFPALPANHPPLNEAEATTLYSAEEEALYGSPYPPTDNGGTGVAIAQVVQNAGLISGFNHYVDIDSVLAAMMDGPVIVGVNWYTSFDTPTPSGIVVIAPGATVRGGHEILMRSYNADTKMFGLDNSWGPTYGVNGSFSWSVSTFTTLLSQQGDATAFVPLANKPTETVTIPGFGGHHVAYVESALTDLGLVPVTTADATSTVVGTSPKDGTVVEKGSSVTIVTV